MERLLKKDSMFDKVFVCLKMVGSYLVKFVGRKDMSHLELLNREGEDSVLSLAALRTLYKECSKYGDNPGEIILDVRYLKDLKTRVNILAGRGIKLDISDSTTGSKKLEENLRNVKSVELIKKGFTTGQIRAEDTKGNDQT